MTEAEKAFGESFQPFSKISSASQKAVDLNHHGVGPNSTSHHAEAIVKGSSTAAVHYNRHGGWS
jgi:hypothetical protein